MVGYVQTQDNPANLLTRGQTAGALEKNELWWRGPQWLSQERLWPEQPATAEAYVAQETRSTAILLTLRDIQNHQLPDSFENRFLDWNKYLKFSFVYMKCLAQRGNWNLSEVQLRQLGEKILFHKLQKKYFH